MAPGPSQPTLEFSFVQVSGQGSTRSSKRQVRSHAARNSQARRQRVLAYQSEQVKETKRKQGLEDDSDGWDATFALMPIRPQSPLSASRTDPFRTFARSVAPFESYLLDHFVHHVVGSAITCLPPMTVSDEKLFRNGMATHWIQLAVNDPGMLAGIFMAACRNLATLHHADIYRPQALKYRSECIGTLRRGILSEGTSVSDFTVTKTLALASDALTTGDHDAATQHLGAVQEMVRLRGGLESFGGRGFLEKLVIWFVMDPMQKKNTIIVPCLESTLDAVSS